MLHNLALHACTATLLTCAALGGVDLPNSTCPVMTEEAADAEFHVTYRGKEVYFCCDKCIQRFQAAPERYLSRLPQFAGAVDSAGAISSTPDASTNARGAADSTAGGAAEESAGSPAGTEGPEAVPLAGRLHPVVVHFPLAAIPVALLSFLAWRVTGRSALAAADVVPLAVGAAAAVVAVVTGNIAHDHTRFSGRLANYVSWHQVLSITAMSLVLAAAVLRAVRWRSFRGVWPILYMCLLVLASGCLAVTGFFGGSLVFGVDHLRW